MRQKRASKTPCFTSRRWCWPKWPTELHHKTCLNIVSRGVWSRLRSWISFTSRTLTPFHFLMPRCEIYTYNDRDDIPHSGKYPKRAWSFSSLYTGITFHVRFMRVRKITQFCDIKLYKDGQDVAGNKKNAAKRQKAPTSSLSSMDILLLRALSEADSVTTKTKKRKKEWNSGFRYFKKWRKFTHRRWSTKHVDFRICSSNTVKLVKQWFSYDKASKRNVHVSKIIKNVGFLFLPYSISRSWHCDVRGLQV